LNTTHETRDKPPRIDFGDVTTIPALLRVLGCPPSANMMSPLLAEEIAILNSTKPDATRASTEPTAAAKLDAARVTHNRVGSTSIDDLYWMHTTLWLWSRFKTVSSACVTTKLNRCPPRRL